MMKKMKKMSMIALLTISVGTTYGQTEENNRNQVYLGFGSGLEYGGIGAKIEYLPVKNIGVFGGLGFNF